MICRIYPVPAPEGAFQWKWQWEGERKSSRAFEWYYDCVEDARSHGARINLDRAHEHIATASLHLKIVAKSVRVPAPAIPR